MERSPRHRLRNPSSTTVISRSRSVRTGAEHLGGSRWWPFLLYSIDFCHSTPFSRVGMDRTDKGPCPCMRWSVAAFLGRTLLEAGTRAPLERPNNSELLAQTCANTTNLEWLCLSKLVVFAQIFMLRNWTGFINELRCYKCTYDWKGVPTML